MNIYGILIFSMENNVVLNSLRTKLCHNDEATVWQQDVMYLPCLRVHVTVSITMRVKIKYCVEISILPNIRKGIKDDYSFFLERVTFQHKFQCYINMVNASRLLVIYRIRCVTYALRL